MLGPSTESASVFWSCVPTWPWMATAMTGGAIMICSALGFWLTASGWTFRRDGHGSQRPLTILLAGLGFSAGIVAALTIVALPEGSSFRYMSGRLRTLTHIELTDADLVWWLIPPAGAVIGIAAAKLLTSYNWRLSGASRTVSVNPIE